MPYKCQALPSYGIAPILTCPDGMEITAIWDAQITQLFVNSQKATIFNIQLLNKPDIISRQPEKMAQIAKNYIPWLMLF